MLSAITTLSGSARLCKRGARFGVSPNDASLLQLTCANEVADHHQSCGDAHAGLQGRASSLQITYGGDQLQPRAHGPLRVVLMGLRIPKYRSTPSPMYFATNPPKRCTVSATHFW